ncbi:MAG: STAS domain-containing protein [Pseudomonadota bacterium]
MAAQLNDSGEGELLLSGELDFETVPELLTESLRQFAALDSIVVNMSGVERSNSAGLALLIEWRSWAATQNRQLHIANPPESLRQIAQVCDAAEFLENH